MPFWRQSFLTLTQWTVLPSLLHILYPSIASASSFRQATDIIICELVIKAVTTGLYLLKNMSLGIWLNHELPWYKPLRNVE